MKRFFAVAVCGLSVSACSSLPSWMQLELPGSVPAATTMQFESEPAGAEARTSLGQSCRTPCSVAVSASDFSVTFNLPGYQPQTVPVKLVTSTEPIDPNAPASTEGARLVPNPVFVEMVPAGPPARKPAPVKKKPKAPRPAPTASAPQAAPAPAPAPATPWPPPTR